MTTFALQYYRSTSAGCLDTIMVHVYRAGTDEEVAEAEFFGPKGGGAWGTVSLPEDVVTRPIQFQLECRGATLDPLSDRSLPVSGYRYNWVRSEAEAPACAGEHRTWSNPSCWSQGVPPSARDVVVLNGTSMYSRDSVSVGAVVCIGACTLRTAASGEILAGAFSDGRMLTLPTGTPIANEGTLTMAVDSGRIAPLRLACAGGCPAGAAPFPLAGVIAAAEGGAATTLLEMTTDWAVAVEGVMEVVGPVYLVGTLLGAGTLRAPRMSTDSLNATAHLLLAFPSAPHSASGSLHASVDPSLLQASVHDVTEGDVDGDVDGQPFHPREALRADCSSARVHSFLQRRTVAAVRRQRQRPVADVDVDVVAGAGAQEDTLHALMMGNVTLASFTALGRPNTTKTGTLSLASNKASFGLLELRNMLLVTGEGEAEWADPAVVISTETLLMTGSTLAIRHDRGSYLFQVTSMAEFMGINIVDSSPVTIVPQIDVYSRLSLADGMRMPPFPCPARFLCLRLTVHAHTH